MGIMTDTISNKELMFMDYGLCIFTHPNGSFQVQKIKTHRSPTCVLHNEEVEDCSFKMFNDLDAAYDFCLKFCESGIEEANLTECHVQLAYNPTGYSLKVKNLDNIRAANPEDAHELGMKQVVAFFEEEGIAKRVGDNFELKVIPVR